jgi:hypothetical protein
LTNIDPAAAKRTEAIRDDAIALIVEALSKLRFGAINLTVHEGKLVQVDVTERKRFQT